jgi:hypothetical protein
VLKPVTSESSDIWTSRISKLTPEERKEELRLVNEVGAASAELQCAVDAVDQAHIAKVEPDSERWSNINERHDRCRRRYSAAVAAHRTFWRGLGVDPLS